MLRWNQRASCKTQWEGIIKSIKSLARASKNHKAQDLQSSLIRHGQLSFCIYTGFGTLHRVSMQNLDQSFRGIHLARIDTSTK